MDTQTLFVGIDISKFKHDVAIVDTQKNRLTRPFVIGENRGGYQKLCEKLTYQQNKLQAKTVYIGMEATGDYWKNLCAFLQRQSPDYHVVVINPVQTKAHAKTELRRATTDPVCAVDIACFMAEKKPAASYQKTWLFEQIKELDRYLFALKKQRSANCNRLRIELGKVAPEIEQHISKITGLQLLTLLSCYPTAEAIRQATFEELRQIRYGKKQWRLSEPFVKKIKELAQDSIAYKTGPEAGVAVQSLVTIIELLQSESENVKQQIQKLYENAARENESILASIKGISQQTAITMEACIGDVKRFSNAKKIVAYFGLNPTVNTSGTSKNKKAHLEKKGNSLFRQKIFLATLNMIQTKQEPFYSYYIKLTKKGKPKLVAIGATMRKLLVTMYQMLKNNKTFEKKYLRKK